MSTFNSTGPRTPEGKAASMNSLRHGLRARTVVLPGENREEFQQLCDDLEAEWQPLTRTELFYVEQLVAAQWKLKRLEVAEASLLQQTLAAKIQVPLLDRLGQAQARMERSFSRAQHELQQIQKSRKQTQSPSAPADVNVAHASACSAGIRAGENVPPQSPAADVAQAIAPAAFQAAQSTDTPDHRPAP
jgi:hypothetical protein